MEQAVLVGSVTTADDERLHPLLPYVAIEPMIRDDLPINLSGMIIDEVYSSSSLALPRWLPVIAVDQLSDSRIIHHFLLRVIVLAELNRLMKRNLTRGGVVDFHSRHKLLLLAHSQPQYRALGPFVAAIDQQPIAQFMIEYRQHFMDLLSIPSTVGNHTNVLSHMQGYFRPQLAAQQRQALANLIQDYLNGQVTLDVPVNLIKDYLQQYPDAYLLQQSYFKFYPEIHHSYQLAE